MHNDNGFMLFAGTSHPELSQQIAEAVGVQLGKIQIETFPDGEIGVHVLDNVRGRDVFLLQSVARNPNLYLMELLILVDAMKRASARSIVAVLPYFGYARQDRKGTAREPITAKLVADLLERAGVTRVLTMDLHTEQIQGFFNIPVDNLYAMPLFVEAIKQRGVAKCAVVTPDVGSIKLARSFAEALKCDYAIVDKRRLSAKRVEMNALIGDVKDRDVWIVDDICSTGQTLEAAAKVCKKAGAKRVFAAVTHGIFSGKAFEESAIEKMLVSNTIPLPPKFGDKRVKVVSAAPLFAKAIDSIVGAKSISSLYNRA